MITFVYYGGGIQSSFFVFFPFKIINYFILQKSINSKILKRAILIKDMILLALEQCYRLEFQRKNFIYPFFPWI